MLDKYLSNTETISRLCKKYPGLRGEDLCQMNPEYSCVICRRECYRAGEVGRSCPEHEKCSESKFALRYNFK